MISIIICSRDAHLLATVSQSVQETIGVAYEIISIDNSKGDYSIFEAYNVGAEKSKFQYLCFMHEDLVFHTPNWGELFISYLSDVSIGLIGVAGSTYKSRSNSAWWGAPGIPGDFRRFSFKQSAAADTVPEYYYLNPLEDVISDVVTLDGLWLGTRKETWQKNKFDEQTFKGFHFYDLDFCLQIKQSLRVCVIYDIVIEHQSHGSINKSWVESSLKFHEKWKKVLPVTTSPISPAQIQWYEKLTAVDFMNKLKDFGFNRTVILKIYLQYLQIYSIRDYLWLLKRNIAKPFKFLREQNSRF